jgi:NAD(P)-dependent dehydrogenase (short-subunit alcohol dehydrogenase family)
MMLQGRAALVTGASEGLGVEIARHYVAAGASVMVCARSAERLEAVADDLRTQLAAGQSVAWMACDVTDAAAVERLVAATLEAFGSLHVLVNNAGVIGPLGPLEDVDWAEWVRTIEINLYGTVYPCRAVLPHFQARGYGKIVNLSGGGATNPLPRMSAYAASKAAVVRFTETLAEEGRPFGIDVNAVAPGPLNTRIMDRMHAAGTEALGPELFRIVEQIRASGGTPLEKAAALCVWLGAAGSDGITGKLISAVWDPWRELGGRRQDLQETDIYTLRRIMPKDRGKDW